MIAFQAKLISLQSFGFPHLFCEREVDMSKVELLILGVLRSEEGSCASSDGSGGKERALLA